MTSFRNVLKSGKDDKVAIFKKDPSGSSIEGDLREAGRDACSVVRGQPRLR